MSNGWKIQPVANDENVRGGSVFTVKDQLYADNNNGLQNIDA